MGAQLLNRTERLEKIERLLFRSSGGLRAVEIAESCGIDRRTVYRDLSTLSKAGVPISQEDGRFFINREYYLVNMRLNVNEAVALFLAARVLSRHADQQNPHVVSALNKLSHNLPDSLAAHVSYLVESLRGNPVDRAFVAVLEMMIHAWVERRKLKMWCSLTRAGDVEVREFSVYFIEPTTTGGLYVIGHDDLTQKIQSVKLEWIKRAKLLDTAYEIPAAFDRRAHLASAWGIGVGDTTPGSKVTLAFSADVTPLIKERIWHTSQQIETLEDKRCTLTVHVTDWHELLPWIRSWGAQVEVLEPQSLRDALAKEAGHLAAMYNIHARS